MNQQDQQRLALQARQIQQGMQKAQQDLQQVEQQLKMIKSTREGIEELSKKEEQDVIAPIGEGVYMPSEIKNTEKTLVEVGAGVVLEKTPDQAIITLGDRKDSLLDVKKKLKAQQKKLQRQYQQIAQQIQQQRQQSE